ncbi:MAG: selenide, water dikinase SelD [Rhodobacterales bacterium]|nr:selenide, water dikinase SelD [Rhodobacterales bacterium]
MQRLPLTQDLVLIGGGHTHALILKRWGMRALAGVRVTVIDPSPVAAYSGMLPGFVAGHYTQAELEIDLVRLARFAEARLVLGAATGIDLEARTVTVAGRPPIAFDVLSIDIGITSEMPDLPGFAVNGVPAKPLGVFAQRWAKFVAAHSGDVAVIGGGVAGVELALAMAYALRGTRRRVTIVEQNTALAMMTPIGERMARDVMRDARIGLIEGVEVTEVRADGVSLGDGRTVAAAFVVGAAGALAQGWLAKSGLALQDGFVVVDRFLRSSDPVVFAAGDCAHMAESPRPKAGVYAVRQAPVLFDNLRVALEGADDLQTYKAQKDYLKLVSLGSKVALAEKWGTAHKGHVLWRWKDRIDRSFMARFRDLAPMALPLVPLTAAKGLRDAASDQPLCAGCGAKVGRGVLAEALAGLTMQRGDVDRLPWDDAAILRTGGVRQVITTDHLRTVTADPVLMTRIAAVHALGDVWAMGALPQAVLVSLILPRLSATLQARTMAEIMAVAGEVLGAAGAAIAGGHTSTGDELTIGFTVTGLLEREPVTLGGAKAGDALLLTKPLGSGAILAAEMRGVASAAVVVGCYRVMVQEQGTASHILSKAHAMTDVTGFGLAGHLAGMCEASGVAAELDLAAMPVMPGAVDLAAAGVRSSLWVENRGSAGAVHGAAGPRGELLFDPQTCGGLLAAVAPEEADAVLANLVAAGYQAAQIGRIVTGLPQITCR